jgi:transposase
MNSVPVFVGVDYHDEVVQVCVMDATGQVMGQRRLPNDHRQITKYVARFGDRVHAGIEVCTGSSALADILVAEMGWIVDLAHPGYVRRMKHSPDKSDLGDARLLADLVRVGYLPRVWLAPPAIRELREMVRYRQQIANQIRCVKLRIGALLRSHRCGQGPAGRWSSRWIAWIEEEASVPSSTRWIIRRHLAQIKYLLRERAMVERQLRHQTRHDSMVEHLQTFTGIGPVTAWTIRAEIGRFDRFRNSKQLARFCGLSPRNASSGMRQADAGLVKACNGALRVVFIEAAHRLMRHDARWQSFSVKQRQAGKPYNIVAAAVANRWVRWLYHQMQPEVLAA